MHEFDDESSQLIEAEQTKGGLPPLFLPALDSKIVTITTSELNYLSSEQPETTKTEPDLADHSRDIRARIADGARPPSNFKSLERLLGRNCE